MAFDHDALEEAASRCRRFWLLRATSDLSLHRHRAGDTAHFCGVEVIEEVRR